MTIRVRAPASTANLGPGFDCAAVALDLWNELELVEGGDGEADLGHVGVRAFCRIAEPDGWTFRFADRIPRERGLGSSASVIALGLVAATLVSGGEGDPEELLRIGAKLEGHCDNLSAALAGGVCLTWDGHIARIARRAPAEPVVVIPRETLLTVNARTSLPDQVAHSDATASLAHASVLAAGLASGDANLFAAALDGDRLHEPFRSDQTPILSEVREDPPPGSLGATLSGAGPAVVVWAEPDAAETCAEDLRRRYPEAEVRVLPVTAEGAGPV